jgi:hypothetical protein
MDQPEYERRQQQLDEEEERALELIRTGFRAQRRALDLVWMTSPQNRSGRAGLPGILDLASAAPPPPAPLATISPFASPPPSLPAPAATAPLAPLPPPAPEAPPRRPAAELYNQIFDALERVPEVFDRTHLLPYLQPQPRRSSLHGALEEMCRDKLLRKERSGSGRVPSQYRRLEIPAGAEEPQAG